MSERLPARINATMKGLDGALKRAGLVPADQAAADHPMNLWLNAMIEREHKALPSLTAIMLGNFQEGYVLRTRCSKASSLGAYEDFACNSIGEPKEPKRPCCVCGLVPGREKDGVLIDTDDVTAWPALEE